MLRRPGANRRIAACTSPMYLHDTIGDKLLAIDHWLGQQTAVSVHALLMICRSVSTVINIPT